jgi:O-antigen/teichoic acid export membrane protein
MVGTYSFANTAPRFISESFGSALWATLYAHTIRADDDAASLRAFAATLRIFSLIVFPIMLLTAAQAHQVIAVLLGARWEQSAMMLQVLLITAALSGAGGLGSALLYAKGRSDIQFRIGVEQTILRILCVACLPWFGIKGMLAGFIVTYIYIFFRNLHASTSFMKVSMLPYLAEMRGPALASAAAGLACWYAGRITHTSLFTIAAEMALGFLLYCLLLWLTERQNLHGDIKELFKLMKRA